MRSVHEEGYRVEPLGDGTFRFTRPDGREIPGAPPRPSVGDDAVSGVVEQLTEAGLDADALDHYPQWDASSLDLGLAIETMWCRAVQPTEASSSGPAPEKVAPRRVALLSGHLLRGVWLSFNPDDTNVDRLSKSAGDDDLRHSSGEGTMKYDAFMTYSHAEDAVLGSKLHAALHGFAKPWYRLRAVRIFRDETALTVEADLPSSIERALLKSKYLLLLASPEAARSKWVNREVDFWLDNRRGEPILIALTRGRLEWDDVSGDFSHTSDAVPDALRGRLSAEPLWVDLRDVKRDRDFTKKHPDFLGAVATLAATMRGQPKDELIGEDVRQHRRARRIASAAVITLALLLLAAVVFAVAALNQSRIAKREAARARYGERISKSRELAAHSRYVMETQPDLALLLSVEAVRFEETSQARDSLLAALLERREAEAFLRFEGERARVVAFNRDGSSLATGNDDGGLLFWDLRSRKLVRTVRAEPMADVCDLAFRETDDALVYLLCDGTLGLLPPGSSQPLWTSVVPTPGKTFSVAIHPDGGRLATGGDSLLLWDTATGRTIGDALVAGDPEFFAQDVAFSPDGRFLAVGNPSEFPHGTVELWDARTHSRITSFTQSFPQGSPIEVAFAADSSLAVSNPSGLFLWDAGSSQRKINPPSVAPMHLATSADGSVIATTSWASPSSLIVFRLAGGVPQEARLDAHASEIVDVAVSPDGRLAASVSGSTLILWNLSGEPDLGVLGSRIQLPGKRTTAAAVHGDTATVAAGHADGTAVLTSISTLETSTLKFGPSSVTSIAFDPTGNLVAAGLADGAVAVWGRSAERIVFRDMSHRGEVLALAFSPDSRLLASGSKDTDIRLRRLEHPTDSGIVLTRQIGSAWVIGLAFSPDGRTLAAASAVSVGQVELWNVATGQRQYVPLDIAAGFGSALVFAPHSAPVTLAAASSGGVVKTWDVTNPQAPIHGIETPAGLAVMQVTYDPWGDSIITGHRNGEVRLWDAASGQMVGAPIPGTDRWVLALGLMELDGERVLAVVRDGEITFVPFDTETWVAEACARAGRVLTRKERSRYLGSSAPQEPGCYSEQSAG